MKPIDLHEQAMALSFKAKVEREKSNSSKERDFYAEAANLETQAAEYYFEKADLEPTRSILLRSAATLHLKAGNYEEAERLIFWGLINLTSNPTIKDQLYKLLDFCLSYKFDKKNVSTDYLDYVYGLQSNSIHYSIEPKTNVFTSAVPLSTINEFSSQYIKSLKAFSRYKFKREFSADYKSEQEVEDNAYLFEDFVNPLVTSAAFGSFKFAIANDYMNRIGEGEKVVSLKKNIIHSFHEEVFTKELDSNSIQYFKQIFTSDEIDDIFRPILNIKSAKSNYKVAYYDKEDFNKHYLPSASSSIKGQLLPVRQITPEDAGVLENVMVHARSIGKGSSRKVIFKQLLKSSVFDYAVDMITPRGRNPIILSSNLDITVNFDSNSGFTFTIDDLPVPPVTASSFTDGLIDFYTEFVRIVKEVRDEVDSWKENPEYLNAIKKYFANPGALD